jgi:hypothetical protein
MAIPAIDTVVTDMVLVAERHRLFERFVQSAWITGQRTPQKYYAGCDHHRRQQAQSEKKSESPMKKLWHVDRPIDTSSCVLAQTFRGRLSKRSF